MIINFLLLLLKTSWLTIPIILILYLGWYAESHSIDEDDKC